MCGIFAYLNHGTAKQLREVADILIAGLKRLEYRGYDSAGLCIAADDACDALPVVVKKEGPVRALEDAMRVVAGIAFDAHVRRHSGIAHTRWATHGPACDKNAHPHTSDADNEFVVVHNGIITNFSYLRKALQQRGMVFRSDTDTEVIAVLFKFIYDESLRPTRTWKRSFDEMETGEPRKETPSPIVGSSSDPSPQPKMTFAQLAAEVMSHMEGAFAIVVKSRHYPEELVACKRGSPLLVGVRRGQDSTELFLASDASAIVEHTQKCIYLEDADVLHFRDGEMKIASVKDTASPDSASLTNVTRAIKSLEMNVEQIMKGDYAHFMLKEIYEQPESILNTMAGRMDFGNKSVRLGGFTPAITNMIRRARRIVFVACGTSYYSAMTCRNVLEELSELPVQIEVASDFLDRQPTLFRDDVVCFVSQSGETADTLRALEYCKAHGTLTVGFVNVVGSAISRMTDVGAHINCGCEIGVASTKAYTSQIACIVMLALLLSADSVGKAQRRREIYLGLETISPTMRQALALDSEMKALAASLQNEKSILLMGRGFQHATCLEGALKIKELAYIHTEGLAAGELKHGPLALIDENMPVIMIATKDRLYEKVKSSMQQILARKGRPIVFLTEPDDDMSIAHKVILLPKTVDCLQSLINIIPLQLLAYHIAVAKGLNVDCPRNLAKSVTVE